jgi:predicted ATPase
LIAKAAMRSQVIVVSHAPPLIDALQALPECHSIMLEKTLGETVTTGGAERPVWHWPAR